MAKRNCIVDRVGSRARHDRSIVEAHRGCTCPRLRAEPLSHQRGRRVHELLIYDHLYIVPF